MHVFDYTVVIAQYNSDRRYYEMDIKERI